MSIRILLLASAAFALLSQPVSAQFMLTTESAPIDDFSSQQTVNITVDPGEFLFLAYGDDSGGAGITQFDFNCSAMPLAYNVGIGNTHSAVYFFANTTAAAITGDLEVNGTAGGQGGWMYGAYTLSGGDTSVMPLVFSNTKDSSGVSDNTMDVNATGLSAGQFIFGSAANGNGSSTIMMSPGSIVQQASTGGSGGDFLVANFEVTSAGNQILPSRLHQWTPSAPQAGSSPLPQYPNLVRQPFSSAERPACCSPGAGENKPV